MGYNPQMVNGQAVTNWKDKLLYSSAVIGSAQSADSTIFNYNVGSKPGGANNENVQADYRHTNTMDGGHMSERDWMDIVSVAVEIPVDIGETPATQLLARLYLKIFSTGNNEAYTGLIRHFPAGNGLVVTTTQNAKAFFSNGLQGAEQRVKFAIPIRLEPNEQYKAIMLIQNGALTTAAVDTIVRVLYRGAGPQGIGAQ